MISVIQVYDNSCKSIPNYLKTYLYLRINRFSKVVSVELRNGRTERVLPYMNMRYSYYQSHYIIFTGKILLRNSNTSFPKLVKHNDCLSVCTGYHTDWHDERVYECYPIGASHINKINQLINVHFSGVKTYNETIILSNDFYKKLKRKNI